MKKALILALALILTASMVFAQASEETTEKKDHVDVFTVGLINWPDSMDPSTAIGKKITRWMNVVYDTLLYTENDGSISSQLCESWTKLDPLTWEFKLKKGITFHNGDAFTAADVKYSFDRVLKNTTGANSSNVRTVVSTVAEVQIVDDYTVRFITKYEDPIFENRIASYLSVYIVPMNFIETNGNEFFANNAMGTGPYMIESITPETMVMKYYEGYYGDKPIADRIEFRYIVEPVAMATALLNGEIDLCPDLTIETAEILKAKAAGEVDVFNKATSTSHLLMYNTNNPVLADAKVRQAMNISIDRHLLADTLWNGFASVPNGYNYPEYGDFYIPDYPEYEYNVEKAKQLLAESSYNGELVEYVLNPGYYEMGNEAAEAICAMWKEIGINAVVKYEPTLSTKTMTEAVRNWSNGLRFSDPLGGLWCLWGEGTDYEKYLWNDYEEFNKLGHLVEKETDVAQRNAYYRQMMEIWDGQALGTIIYCPDYVWAVSSEYTWDFEPGKAINYRGEFLKFK